MKIGNPKLIFDPHEWLPPDGESKILHRSVGADVVLEVFYQKASRYSNKEDEAILFYKREIHFKFALYFIRTPFPGADFFEYDGNSPKSTVGALNEYLNSEYAKKCNEVFQSFSGMAPNLRHFSIPFLSDNSLFHVLAKDVSLSGELAIN
jgi:hypothetical protein